MSDQGKAYTSLALELIALRHPSKSGLRSDLQHPQRFPLSDSEHIAPNESAAVTEIHGGRH